MANKYLDSTGVKHLWDKIKNAHVTIATNQTISGVKTYTGNNIFKNNYFEIKASSVNDDSWIKLTNATDSGYYAFGIRRPYDTYGLQMKYHPASGNDEYYNIWHAGNFTPSNYLTISAAAGAYLGKTAKAESAKTADIATEANYATEAGKSGYATSAAEASWATEAGDAERAMNDSDDNPIHTTYIKVNTKGAANGVAPLDATGKIASAYLPSYVDDVINGVYVSPTIFNNTSGTAISGETGKIYVDTNNNKTYRWSGSAYVEISASLALGETSSTAYAGDKGKANAAAITSLQSGKLDKSGGTVEGDLTIGTTSELNNLIMFGNINGAFCSIDVGGNIKGYELYENGTKLTDKYFSKDGGTIGGDTLVSGTLNAMQVIEFGSTLSEKYLGINATAKDSEKLGGTAASSYATQTWVNSSLDGFFDQVVEPAVDAGLNNFEVNVLDPAIDGLNDKFANYLTTSAAASTYFPKSGGTIEGGLSVNDVLNANTYVWTEEVYVGGNDEVLIDRTGVYAPKVEVSEVSMQYDSSRKALKFVF